MSVTGPRLQQSLFERSRPGRGGSRLPPAPPGALERIPATALRAAPPALPEVDEATLVRHYLNLSQLNWSVDGGFYPLGSCTMKYNPKVNEWAVRLPGLANLHPLAPDETAQGTLALLWELQGLLAEIGGMDAVTLSPAAGAHGELTGILLFRAYHRSRGDAERAEILVPDSAHGTNPATASMAGYATVNIASAADGGVDLDAFRAALGPRTAGVMITNPSTLGLFESRIVALVELVHAAGGLVYMDGANMNAVLGHFRPGDAGVDAMHFNVHKTFSTPHGGGGPGAGPVAVRSHLAPFLPGPLVVREPDGRFRLERPGERPESIGRVRSFVGSTGVLVRAWAYIRAHGADGLREVSEDAVLAANYLRGRLAATYDVPFDRPCMHEFVASAATLKRETGVRTLDVAKRLIDKGFHPPTIYFPHIVEEAMLIEPTETESLETLDAFAGALAEIAAEARTDPALVTGAPHTAPVRRLDEATAARQPNLRWRIAPE
jgi:glycine cleavage system P protein (glycine dehydrogenase) subunit 2